MKNKDKNEKKGTAIELYSVDSIKEALIQSRGILLAASKILGCSRTTIYNYILRYPVIKECIEEAREQFADEIEEIAMEKAIHEKDSNLLKFFMCSHPVLKKRGYSTKQEITGEDGIPLIPEINVNIIKKDNN